MYHPSIVAELIEAAQVAAVAATVVTGGAAAPAAAAVEGAVVGAEAGAAAAAGAGAAKVAEAGVARAAGAATAEKVAGKEVAEEVAEGVAEKGAGRWATAQKWLDRGQQALGYVPAGTEEEQYLDEESEEDEDLSAQADEGYNEDMSEFAEPDYESEPVFERENESDEPGEEEQDAQGDDRLAVRQFTQQYAPEERQALAEDIRAIRRGKKPYYGNRLLEKEDERAHVRNVLDQGGPHQRSVVNTLLREKLGRYYAEESDLKTSFEGTRHERSIPEVRLTLSESGRPILFLHGIALPGGDQWQTSGTNRSLQNTDQLSTEDKIDVLLGLRPTVSASSLIQKDDVHTATFYPFGLILNEGTILSSFAGNPNTNARGLRSRYPTTVDGAKKHAIQKNFKQDLERTLSGKMRWKDGRGSLYEVEAPYLHYRGRFNEFIVEDPNASAFYVRSFEMKDTDLKEAFKVAAQFGLPVYDLDAGKKYSSENGTWTETDVDPWGADFSAKKVSVDRKSLLQKIITKRLLPELDVKKLGNTLEEVERKVA